MIIVSAQVLLVLTLAFGLGLDNIGQGLRGWETRLKICDKAHTHLVLNFHDQRPRESPRSKQRLAPPTPPKMRSHEIWCAVSRRHGRHVLNKMDDIKIRVSYMKTRVRMDS